MTVIYVDTLFLLNAVIDYLLLLSAARLAGEPLRRGRFALYARQQKIDELLSKQHTFSSIFGILSPERRGAPRRKTETRAAPGGI